MCMSFGLLDFFGGKGRDTPRSWFPMGETYLNASGTYANRALLKDGPSICVSFMVK